VYSMFVSRFSGCMFCVAATGTVQVYFELSHVSGLGLDMSIEFNIQSKVVFTIRPTQLYRSCTSGRYSIRLQVSALHISHHQIGHKLFPVCGNTCRWSLAFTGEYTRVQETNNKEFCSRDY